MIHYFEGQTADEVWKQAAAKILTPGVARVQPSRAGDTQELMHVVLEIRDPRQRWIGARREALNVAFALAEVIWILDGRNDSAFLNYFNRKLPAFAGKGATYHGAYGYRLRHGLGLDQLVRAAQALRANSDSRQVVLQIWNPPSDMPDETGRPVASDIPCNLLSMLKVRDGRLDWVQVMRSNDAYRGTPHNIVQFTSLQEVMAGWIGVQPGCYTHWSDSFHFYKRDLEISPIATSDAALPLNVDSLAVTLDEFNTMWPGLLRVALAVTNESKTSEDLRAEMAAFEGPETWANVLRILVAEGIRRRQAKGEIGEVISRVSNPVLVELWTRWIARLG